MAENGNDCKDHSGLCVDLINLKHSDERQWESIKDLHNKINALILETKSCSNRTLGGLVVGLVLLSLNLAVAFTKG
jgi:hypothetical protein